jgi:hypothetical protein
MAYVIISNWSAQASAIDMEEIEKGKFVPMIMRISATAAQTHRTGENSFSVCSHYPDATAATEQKTKSPPYTCRQQ